MCGFAGLLDTKKKRSREELAELALRMAAPLRHRGPDDESCWAEAGAGIALGFRRLAILDLSEAGNQPMQSHSGRFVLVFNGEIYNFVELKRDLQQAAGLIPFRGHSDTEVLLAGIEHWGVAETCRRANGMFAFAAWDREQRQLWLARDRFGEKPLYYGWRDGVFLFGSELKALRAYPGFSGRIDRNAVSFHLRFNCIPAPYSIYEGVRKMPPASVLRVTGPDAEPEAYWSMLEVAEQGVRQPFRGSDDEAMEALRTLMLDAVRRRMVADVPLGAFLSGGIDSSLIVSLMQAQSAEPVRTFSVGFNEASHNEAVEAHYVARHIGTEHTELYITAQEALNVIPELPYLYDEPFADSSQIPTYLVSKLARHYVTVALSGDGGDEVFAGYNRHFWSRRVWKRFAWMPLAMRHVVARAITGVSANRWDELFHIFGPLLPRDWRQRIPGYKLHKIAQVMSSSSPRDMYLGLASHWPDPERVVLQCNGFSTAEAISRRWPKLPEFEQQAMYMDTITYLVNDILTKVDRATMAVSLEGRIPFLDPRVVEFAWSLPMNMKIRDNQGKWILRQLLYRYVPRELVDRPKMGFGIPLADWLRGPLRPWAEELLKESRLKQDGILDPAPIRAMWAEHLSARRDWQFHLWDVLMLQAWCEASQSTTAELQAQPARTGSA
jgi:asparagine synthase (glutamine-hydrolysing)